MNGPHPSLLNTLSHISSEGFVKRSLVGGLALWLSEQTSIAFLSVSKRHHGFLLTPWRMQQFFRQLCVRSKCSVFVPVQAWLEQMIRFSCFINDVTDSNTTVQVQHVFWAMLVQCHDLSPSHILWIYRPHLLPLVYFLKNYRTFFWGTWHCKKVDMSQFCCFDSWPVSLCRDVLPSADLDKDEALPQATNNNPPEEQQPQETSTAMVHAHTQTRVIYSFNQKTGI